jgi:hypothetical protein
MMMIIAIAFPFTHNLPKTEVQKITKYENLATEITNIWKLNNLSVYSLVIAAKGVVIRNFLKYTENNGLTKNTSRVGQKAVLLQKCHTERKFLGQAP